MTQLAGSQRVLGVSSGKHRQGAVAVGSRNRDLAPSRPRAEHDLLTTCLSGPNRRCTRVRSVAVGTAGMVFGGHSGFKGLVNVEENRRMKGCAA